MAVMKNKVKMYSESNRKTKALCASAAEMGDRAFPLALTYKLQQSLVTWLQMENGCPHINPV